jgi:RimJ/RimL family protein N-acetyltransferase
MNNILLRPWQREDAKALAFIANNRNIYNNVRDLFPSPYTVMNALLWIEYQKEKSLHENFAIIYEGQIAGCISCIHKEDIYRKSAEIGYFIGEPFWNKGLATKAVGEMVSYITSTFAVVRIYAEVFEHNKASMRVLQKNGFYLEGIRRKAVIKNNVLLDDYIWVKLR